MAPRRKKKNTDIESVGSKEPFKAVEPKHFIRYRDEDGQDIESSFATADHADVLHNRLKSHGIPHEYESVED